jgi:hypothetical protein
MAALTWISTRSLKYSESLAFENPIDSDKFIHMAREGSGVPFHLGYENAFYSLNEKIDMQSIVGQASKIKWIVSQENEQLPIEKCFSLAESVEIFDACAFRPQELLNANWGGRKTFNLQDFMFHDGDCFTPKGSGYGSPNPDGSRTRWTWKGVTFSREDVLRLWPDLPCFAAWKQAKAQTWKPPRKLSPDWLNDLPAGQYISIADVVDLLAFGPDRLPIGLTAVEENAARFRAGLALMDAARNMKITMCGHAAFRMPHFGNGLSPVGTLWKIEPDAFADQTLVIDGGRDWIGPATFADGFPERGQATDSVKIVGVTIHRESLRRWLNDLAGRPAPRKRGPKLKFDWNVIEGEARRLFDQHGDFSPDKLKWNAQARLESKLLEFCVREFGKEPGMTQTRAHIRNWLTLWRKEEK